MTEEEQETFDLYGKIIFALLQRVGGKLVLFPEERPKSDFVVHYRIDEEDCIHVVAEELSSC